MNVYHLLRHPIRRKIVTMLGERDKVGFTEMRRDVNVGVGKLYYHLDVLSALITQDGHRKYMLTELGREAYSYLVMGREETGVAPIDVHVGSRREVFLVYVLSRPFSVILFRRRYLGLLVALAFLAGGGLLVGSGGLMGLRAGLDVSILFITDFGEANPDATFMIGKFVLGVLATFTFFEIIARVIFKKGGGTVPLFIGVVFSYAPLVLFTVFWLLTFGVTTPSWLVDLKKPVLHALFFALEAWTLILLTYTINMTKRIKLSSAAAIVFVLVYINIALVIPGLVPGIFSR